MNIYKFSGVAVALLMMIMLVRCFGWLWLVTRLIRLFPCMSATLGPFSDGDCVACSALILTHRVNGLVLLIDSSQRSVHYTGYNLFCWHFAAFVVYEITCWKWSGEIMSSSECGQIGGNWFKLFVVTVSAPGGLRQHLFVNVTKWLWIIIHPPFRCTWC